MGRSPFRQARWSNARLLYECRLSLDRRGGRFSERCSMAKEIQADVICCQEHNLDTTQSGLRKIIYDTTHHHWTRSRVRFATTPIPFTTQFKPGGTMMMVIGHSTGRISSTAQDHMGQWESFTFRGQGPRRLSIISVYQVVTDSPQAGSTTAASQQQSILIRQQDPIRSPRRAFERDLWKFVAELRSQGNEILMVGDFNEVFGSDVDGISKLAADFDLVNLMRVRHSDPLPPTYARGRSCIEYGLATETVADSLLRCGYEAFNERFTTDIDHIISILIRKLCLVMTLNHLHLRPCASLNPTMWNKLRSISKPSTNTFSAAMRSSEETN